MMAQRLRDARREKGYGSAAAAAEAFGFTASTLTSHENGTRSFGVDEAKRYGRAFGKNPGWLLALDKVQPAELELKSTNLPIKELLQVKGSVAAGIWRENIEWPSDEWYNIEVGPSPYPGAERFAVRMDGYSMDRTIPPGSDIECVRIGFGRIEPQIGDLVIAERTNHDLTEMTCKRLDKDGDDWVLRCESTKSEFKDHVLRIGRPDADSASHEETRIVGIVVNAQQRHFRRRL
jgi:SOS-response transcriptional repressor LexA